MVLLHVGQTCDRFGVVHERVELGEIDHGQQDLERDVFVAPGGVTLVRSDLFATLRGFDPLIPVLGEDLDLCWRAQVAGARIVVAPLAKVAHRETIATGERTVTALGTRRASRQDLQRRHQLLVVATGWGRGHTMTTLLALFAMDAMEFVLAIVGRDRDRAGAILGSWRWLLAPPPSHPRTTSPASRVPGPLRRVNCDDSKSVARAVSSASSDLAFVRDSTPLAASCLPKPLKPLKTTSSTPTPSDSPRPSPKTRSSTRSPTAR